MYAINSLRHFKKSKWHFTCAFTILLSYICAQDLKFHNYSSKDGLSQNSVYAITQTKEGFMWFGTQDGLNRFDGKQFQTYFPSYTKNGKTYSQSKMITSLFIDNNDMMWVGTTTGLLLYDRYTNTFKLPSELYRGFALLGEMWVEHIIQVNNNLYIQSRENVYSYNFDKKASITLKWAYGKPKNITKIVSDSEGNVWASSNRDLYILGESVFNKITFPNSSIQKNMPIKDFDIINGEHWIIYENNDVYIYEIKNDKIIKSSPFKEIFNGNKMINSPRHLHQSDANELWIGGRNEGLMKVDLQNKTYISTIGSKSNPSSNTLFVLAFYTTKDKLTWIGQSTTGVSIYDPNYSTIQSYKNETTINGVLPGNKIFSIFSKNDTDFYMGTLTDGLLHLNTTTNKFSTYLPEVDHLQSESKNIYQITAGENNSLWMASWGGLLLFDTNKKSFKSYYDHNDDTTTDLCGLVKLREENTILTGGYKGGLKIFDISKKKWKKSKDINNYQKNNEFRIRYMYEKEPGIVYIGTEARNILKYDYNKGVFTSYPSLLSVSATARHFTFHNSQCWVATDDGLIQCNANDMSIIKVWTTDDGMLNNYCYAVMADSENNVWVSTNQGICKINYLNNICKNYTVENGLLAQEFNTAACHKSKNGDMWFGNIEGANKLSSKPELIEKTQNIPLLVDLKVMNQDIVLPKEIPYIESITLPYSQNFLYFEYQSPVFVNNKSIKYKYRMTGVDTAWVDGSTRTNTSYTQLKPGSYTFSVKASSDGGKFSESRNIKVTIVPPWYLTSTFLVVLGTFLCFSIYFLVKNRFDALKQKLDIKRQKTEAEMQSLRLQMNPHFIFNSLNSINAFIVENKPNLASDYLTKFAKLIRLILSNSKHEFITLDNEIETLQLYVTLEQVRYNNKFTFNISIPKNIETDQIYIPTLIIQPFVENAIWHGFRHTNIIGNIELKVNLDENKSILTIEVSDNGIGRKRASEYKSKSSTQDKSYGIEISSQRLKTLNQKNNISIVDLFDDDENPIGTKIIITYWLIST